MKDRKSAGDAAFKKRVRKPARRWVLGLALAMAAMMSGCIWGGYEEPDYGPGYYGDYGYVGGYWGPDVFIFNHHRGFDHGHAHVFSHRGFSSRSAAGVHGGGAAHFGGGGGHSSSDHGGGGGRH